MNNEPPAPKRPKHQPTPAEIHANIEATRLLEQRTEGRQVPPPRLINFHD